MLNLANTPGQPVYTQVPARGAGVLGFLRGVINLGAPPAAVPVENQPEQSSNTGTIVLIVVAVLALIAVIYFTSKRK